MAHALEALLARIPFDSKGLATVGLPQGLLMIPLTAEVKDLLKPSSLVQRPREGFLDLTDGVERFAVSCSAEVDIVYVHSEFHGGTGFQAALGWRRGHVVFGPALTANHEAERQTEAYALIDRSGISESAVNQALRFLGVETQKGMDEFDSVGLGLGWTDDFAAQALDPS